MLPIKVLVASTTPDVKAEGISAAVAGDARMTLVAGRVFTLQEADERIAAIPPQEAVALVYVGPCCETEAATARWLSERSELVVLQVSIVEDLVRFSLRGIRMASLLTQLRALATRSAGIAPEPVPARGCIH